MMFLDDLKKNRSFTVCNFSKRCDVMQPKGCHMHRIVSSTSSFLIESRRNGFDPGFHEFRSSKKTLSKPAGDGAITLEEFEKLVSSPKLRCQKTTSREEKKPTQQEGEF